MSDDLTPFRWGILGVARINRSLLGPLQHGRHRLVAVASRDIMRAQEYATAHGIPRAHGSYQALLDDPEVDAIYLPLPNALHVEWAVRAAQAGKHVLCEKPIALDGDGVRTLQAAARETGAVITEAFMYRHHPLVARVTALAHDGTIGTLQAVRGTFSFVLDRPGDVRFDPVLGGGSLWDVGCYPVSFARTVIGARPLTAQGMAAWSPSGVDLTFFGQLAFPGDVVAQVHCSFVSPFRTEIEVIGSAGRLVVRRPFKPEPAETIEIFQGDETRTDTVDGPTLYQGEVDDVAEAVRLRRPPLVTLDDSLDNTDAIVTLLEAARTGVTTPLPSVTAR